MLKAGVARCPECGQTNKVGSPHSSESEAKSGGSAIGGTFGPAVQQPVQSPVSSQSPTERFRSFDSRESISTRRCMRCQNVNELTADFCSNCGLPFERSDVEVVPGTVTEGTRPGGFWIRFGAVIVDSIIWGVLGAIIWPVVFGESFWQTTTTTGDGYTLTQIQSGGGDERVGYLLWAVYVVPLVWLFGATLGKKALGLSIIDETGNKPGLVRSIVRFLASFLSAILLLIGFLMAAFREDKRALHDLIAGTYVVHR